MERTVTFRQKMMTLAGRSLAIGDPAPDFRVVAIDLSELRLADLKSKIKIVSTFPSLDTPVCEQQVAEFNRRAAELSSDIMVIGISMDLPFAQKRFCQGHSIDRELLCSDHRYASFGINYGVLIRDLGLLARAAFIIDAANVLRYCQLAGEITRALDYADILQHLHAVIQQPGVLVSPKSGRQCQPCEGGRVAVLDNKSVAARMVELDGWTLVDNSRIRRDFKFKDFVTAKHFLDLIAVLAEDRGHHPVVSIDYNKVVVTLWTHSVNGLTENDFELAKAIDQVRV